MLFRQIVTACALAAADSFVASDEASVMLAINGRTEQLQQVQGHGAQVGHGARHDRAMRKADQQGERGADRRAERRAENKAEREAERKAAREEKRAEKKAEREAQREAKKAERKVAQDTKIAEREKKIAARQEKRQAKLAERTEKQQAKLAERTEKQQAKLAERTEKAQHRGISADGKGFCNALNCRSCCELVDKCDDTCPIGFALDETSTNCVFSGQCPLTHTHIKKDGVDHCKATSSGDDSGSGDGGVTKPTPLDPLDCPTILLQAQRHKARGKDGVECDPAAECGACCKSDDDGIALTSHCTKCMQGYRHEHLAGTCTKCTASNCETCYSHLDQCDQCASGYHMSNHTCFVCPTGANCKLCNSQGHCTECAANYAKNTSTHTCEKKCGNREKWEGGKCVAREASSSLSC